MQKAFSLSSWSSTVWHISGLTLIYDGRSSFLWQCTKRFKKFDPNNCSKSYYYFNLRLLIVYCFIRWDDDEAFFCFFHLNTLTRFFRCFTFLVGERDNATVFLKQKSATCFLFLSRPEIENIIGLVSFIHFSTTFTN